MEWKTITGYPNYQISTNGDVFSTNINKIMSPKKHYKGYLYVTLSNAGDTKAFKIHRLVAQAFLPNPNNLPQVNHIDGDKTNNNYKNLEWCTNSENVKHSYNTGLRKRYKGSDSPLYQKYPITRWDLKAVKCCRIGTYDWKYYPSIANCARDLGISPKYIGQCLAGKKSRYNGYVFEKGDA